jgi:hypothetical protein
MSDSQLGAVVAAAIDEGLLPPGAALDDEEHRPWPVVLLIGLGAWLAALPLLVAVGMLFGDWILRGPLAILFGALLIALSIVLFRSRSIPLFVEQLGLPALLVGGGCFAFGLFHNGPPRLAFAVLALVALGVAAAAGRSWVRNLLGALAAVLVTLAFVSDRALNLDRGTLGQFWLAWHLSLGAWLLALGAQSRLARRGGPVSAQQAIESIASGWLIAVLIGLAWLAGMTFLAGAVVERNIAVEMSRELTRQRGDGGTRIVQGLVSTLLAAAAAWVGASAWPTLRQAWCIGLAAIFVVLAWFMPSLGAVLLALLLTATSQRWLLAGVAGLAAAWIIGAFYYALDYPLAQKALILFVAGVVLGAIAWFGASSGRSSAAGGAERGDGAERARGVPRLVGIAATLALSLAVANVGIWQKEDVIRHGKPVFIQLAPVDPRSLMQGDYMALDFRVPHEGFFESTLSWQRPVALAEIDSFGVARLTRIEGPGAVPGPNELRIELTPKAGRWTVVTDAYFFREGEGERFARARYGEFRVLPDGKALLVGLAGADLQPIR